MKLPYSLESENVIIGCLLVEPATIHLATVSQEDFYNKTNAAAFRAISEMEEPDVVSIQINLLNKGIVRSLEDCQKWLSYAPSSAMLETHCAIVKKMAHKRKLMMIGDKLLKQDYGEDPKVASSIAVEALASTLNISSEKKSLHCLKFLDEFLSSTKGQIFSTGLGELDKAMEGGLHAGGTLMVGGDSGSGKTMLVIQFIRHAVKNMVPCYMVSRDQTGKDIMAKIFAGAVGIPRTTMRTDARTIPMKEIIIDWPLWFYPREEPFDVDSISNMIKIDIAVHGVKIWVVDYLQRIELKGYPELRVDHSRYEKIASKLSDLAQDTNTCGIVISRVTKPSQNISSQHRFSGGAGTQNACDDMLFVHKYDFKNEERGSVFGSSDRMRIVEIIGKRNFTGGYVDLKVDYPYDRYKEWKDWSYQEQEAWNAERREK